MQKFFRNLVILAVVLIAWVALYQIKETVTAYSVSGVVTSVSSGYLGYSGNSFEIYYVWLAGHSDGDKLYAYLSTSQNSWDFSGIPSVGPITLWSIQPWRTGTISVWTTYESFTWDTLYLHIFVKDFPETTTKWYGIQEITFIASWAWGLTDAQWAAIYTGEIFPTISSWWINSNLDTVTGGNVWNFQNLYFEKPGYGKIQFETGLDLRDSEIQSFLENLSGYINMNDGFIEFKPTGSGADLNVNAKLYMYFATGSDFVTQYNNPDMLVVRDASGNIVDSNTLLTWVQGACEVGWICTLIFDTQHFTSFGTKPILTDVTIRSSAGTGARSWDTIYLSFTGSEALTWVSVTIAGNTVNFQWGGTTWYASWILVTGWTEWTSIPFTINFIDYFGNSGNTITGTTDASYVNYSAPTDIRQSLYTSIGNSLTASGIINNFTGVDSSNVTGFTNLFFAKMSGSNELGRITFATGLDLTDTGTQNFLQYELPNSIGMDQWEIRFNPGTGFVGKNATLTMNLPNSRSTFLSSITTGDFIVREWSWGALTGNDMISNVALSGSCTAGDFGCTLNLNVSHFTSFEIARIKNITQTIGYNTIQEAIESASSWDIITVASGVYSENIELKNWPFTLSWLGSPVISGTITLKNANDSISIVGFAPIYTLYADLVSYSANQYYTLRDAIGYIASGGTIFINGWDLGGEFAYENYMEDDQVTINKPMSIIGTGAYRPNIYFDDSWLWWWLVINAQNVTIKNIYFYANYSPVEVAIQTQQSTGVIFNNCVFDSLILENTVTTTLIATGNYRTPWWKPALNTNYSWNILSTPRCSDATCTTFVDDDATLSNLTATGWILSWSFSSGVTWYTITVPYQRTWTITATPTPNNSGATWTGNNYITLLTGWSTWNIVITVTATDTTTTTDYTIMIIRDLPSTDANLSALTVVTGWTLSWSFSSWTYAYTINIPYSQTGSVSITWTKNHTYAIITSWSYSVDLPTAGSTGAMFITVQSESGNTNTYTVNITRAAPSSDGNLSSLTAIGGTLSGTFSSGTYAYTINLAYSYTGSVSITGTKNHAYATITSGSYAVSLPTAGSTGTMFITVQSESGNTQTYTVSVNRDPASTDANLSSLIATGWTLSGTFSSWIYAYTINLPYSQTGSVSITWTKNHTYASITSGSYSLSLPTAGSTGTMFITVTAEDASTKTYTVTVTRSPASTDATLSSLTVSTGTLTPSFASWTTGYAVNFPYAYTGALTITWSKNHTYATISSSTTSLSLPTKWSTGTMFITVQSESGNTNTYTVTITRTPASTDANLSSLTLSTGTLSPIFSSGTTSYTIQMLYSFIGTITSTPVVSNAYATTTWTTSITLSTAGSTGTLSSTVTAEDGTTTKTYTVGITRTASPAVATDSIDWTITVTGWSADLSWATATGAIFTSTGTLHIVGDTTNDYIEISVSWFIINAWGTWDGVLLAPTDLPGWNDNNATTTELWLNSSTNTVLLTVQAWGATDSLTATGWYFTISFVVPWWTNGDTLTLYRSENGSTWIANTPDTTCTLNSSLVCTFRTDHLSYFTVVKTTTSSSGGGGSSSQEKDHCPGGDKSPSFYDNICDSNTWAMSWQQYQNLWAIMSSKYSEEFKNAYMFAHGMGITTKDTIEDADMEWILKRAHMAKMMSVYAIKSLKLTPNTWTLCIFNDVAHQSTEMKFYITLACQLGLMGVSITDFNPEWQVTRAEFGTVLSRALRGTAYNNTWLIYYSNHLNALKNNNIIKNSNPYLKELRWYVMLMLMRANQ